jgi:hypothetical protein
MLIGALIPIVVFVAIGMPSLNASYLAFLVGSIILICGYYHLIYVLPIMSKDVETRLSMEALRVSFWLVIFGLIIIILGFLHLMNLLPPPAWRT